MTLSVAIESFTYQRDTTKTYYYETKLSLDKNNQVMEKLNLFQ